MPRLSNWDRLLPMLRPIRPLGAAYNAKEMKPQAIAAFKQVTDGPAAENAKAALAELSK